MVVVCFSDGRSKVYGYFTWADFKLHVSILNVHREYYEDAFCLNVAKNRFKTFEEKASWTTKILDKARTLPFALDLVLPFVDFAISIILTNLRKLIRSDPRTQHKRDTFYKLRQIYIVDMCARIDYCSWSLRSFGRSHITRQCACSISGAIIFPSFLRLRVDRRKRFEYATCGRNFFQKRRKKNSVFKNIRILQKSNPVCPVHLSCHPARFSTHGRPFTD